MDNPELNEIIGSLQATVNRAYNLGRNSALRRVVDMMKDEESCGELKADEPYGEPLALMAPGSGGATSEPFSPEHEDADASEAPAPWWIRRR